MENVCYDTTNTEVQMAMVVKLHQLQREALSTLTYQNLEDYLSHVIWKNKVPKALHVAVNDVMSVMGSDLVKYLSRQAIISSRDKSLEDFSDLIGGE